MTPSALISRQYVGFVEIPQRGHLKVQPEFIPCFAAEVGNSVQQDQAPKTWQISSPQFRPPTINTKGLDFRNITPSPNNAESNGKEDEMETGRAVYRD